MLGAAEGGARSPILQPDQVNPTQGPERDQEPRGHRVKNAGRLQL